jgi:glyoxylase-like metal-dependent hydrolase (beta-lactamase superfamily II)
MDEGPVTPRPPETAEFGAVHAGGPIHVYPPTGEVEVVKFAVGRFDNDVYVIRSRGQAIVVDGADESDRILAEVDGFEVRAIVQTHNHADHVQALRTLVHHLGAPVYAHPADPMPVPTQDILDGQAVQVGSARLRGIHTPGHTSGSTCYLLEPGGFLFSGDTLFPGGPGNTDADPERFAQSMASLDRLFELPDDTRVCPGHGIDTTIGRERPYVEVWRQRGW